MSAAITAAVAGPPAPPEAALLDVAGLRVRFGDVEAVHGIDLRVAAGEAVGLVGESGSGKSAAMLALLGLHPPGVGVSARRLRLGDADILTLPEAGLRDLRGRRAAMVFQDPMAALNPLLPVGTQVAEVLVRHLGIGWAAARRGAIGLLIEVGIADAADRYGQYPHEFSGGMRQRVMIAAALAGEPGLLIADEPTTALDVTVQAELVRLIRRLQRQRRMGLIWVTHDLALMAGAVDRVIVLHDGHVVEDAPVEALYARPAHPYTRLLLAAAGPMLPEPAAPASALTAAAMPAAPIAAPGCAERPPIAELDGVGVHYLRAGHVSHGLTGIALQVKAGETLAVVGESGCGKSTLGRVMLRLQTPQAGTVRFEGEDITRLAPAAMRRRRRAMQMVFQDPFASLNPRMTIGEALGEPLIVHGLVAGWRRTEAPVAAALARVGLDPAMASRRPHAFSGGQRQRIAIARAMMVEPRLVVADEPLSSLDRSTQAQILELFRQERARTAFSLVLISHDLPVVRGFADRVVVMLGGRIVEQGRPADVFGMPAHPYTQALIACVPIADPARERARHAAASAQAVAGANANADAAGSGEGAEDACPFLARCPHAMVACRAMPALRPVAGEDYAGQDHAAACWLHAGSP